MALKNKKVRFILIFNIFIIIGPLVFISFRYINNIAANKLINDSIFIECSYTLPNAVMETSGLFYDNNLVWTFNDSGDGPYIYAFSTDKNAGVHHGRALAPGED